MTAYIRLSAFAFILFLGSSFTSTEALVHGWEKLGTKKVNYKLDKDVIYVGLKDGTFSKLKIKVQGGQLNMHRMVVEYGNGQKDKIELKQNFGKGSNSRIIDLKGNKRVIKNIVFWYDTKKHFKKKSTLKCIW